MIKIIKTFLKIIFAVFIVCIVIGVIDFFTGDNTWHAVVTEIHKNCYIEHLDNDTQSIYYCPDGEEGQKKYIVEEWEYVVKYATNGKDMVAFHCVYNELSENKEDKFVIFNTTEETKKIFDTQREFADFCKKENIVFSDWKKGDETPYKKINLGNGWTVYDFDDTGIWPDQVLNGYEVIYEGDVSEIIKNENGIVSFRLIVPYNSDYEFSSSNQDLDVKDKPIAEYKGKFFSIQQICYDEVLVLNTLTGEVKVKGD